MKFTLVCLIIIFICSNLLISTTNALSYEKSSLGQDISWPNCNNLKFKPLNFGIVGVNGGLSFHPNPCLSEEALLYRQNLSLYVNTGFPGSPYDIKFKSVPNECSIKDVNCLAYNYGFNAGKYSADYALTNGVVSNNWWLDVETDNSWSNSPSNNIYSLIGEIAAINQSLKPNLIGIYSTPAQWQVLTYNWKNYLPEWLATNSNYKYVAYSACKVKSFTGGKIILAQYIGKTDLDLVC